MATRTWIIMLIAWLVFTISLYLSLRFAGAASPSRLLDHPNARSLHQRPISRIGGAGRHDHGCVADDGRSYGLSVRTPGFILAGLAPPALVSFLDDRRGVAAQRCILVHLLAAVSLLAAGLAPSRLLLPGLDLVFPLWAAIPLTLLFTVWMINLYNFMDGMAGFAGGMAVIGFSTLAWLGRADAGFSAFCLIVATASAGFLVHNFPPARIFLGDTGSTALGFLPAAGSL